MANRGNGEAAGREADRPSEIPPRGWFAVLKRVKAEVKEDNVTLLAADPRWRRVGGGAMVALALWLLGSIGFSTTRPTGALAAVIILLLWLFLSAFVVLLGAEVADTLGESGQRR